MCCRVWVCVGGRGLVICSDSTTHGTLCVVQVIDMIAGVEDPKKAVDLLIAEANKRWMSEESVIDHCSHTGWGEGLSSCVGHRSTRCG